MTISYNSYLWNGGNYTQSVLIFMLPQILLVVIVPNTNTKY